MNTASFENTASNDTHIWGLTLAWSGCWRSNSVLQSNKKIEIKGCHSSSAHLENGGWELGGEKIEKGQEGDQGVSLAQLK